MGVYGCVKIKWKAVLGALAGAAAVLAAAFTVSAATAEGVEVPAIMYHSLLKDPARQGRYVISPTDFENDVAWLESHGYTTVLMADVIAYTQGGELPEKPVLLTFDDGYFNNYVYAFQTARERKVRFILSPIGVFADEYTESGEENPNYSQATWGRLKEMADSGLVEVENHTYDLHRAAPVAGVKQRPGEDDGAYRLRLTEDLSHAQRRIEEEVGVRPTTFVYPFGAKSGTTEEIVRELGFTATLSCEEKVSRITRDPASLYNIGRFLRPAGISSEEFFRERMGLS